MITLKLTLDQVNIVMIALGKNPYEQVADLVGEIRSQAIPQISQPPQPAGNPNPSVPDGSAIQ